MTLPLEPNGTHKASKNPPSSVGKSLPPIAPSNNHRPPNPSPSGVHEFGSDQNSRRSPIHAAHWKLRASTSDASFRTSQSSGELLEANENRATPKDTRVTCTVGSNAAGIVDKWVNYGKGWRPRWFVLQDGVLSYYKVRGPDKIILNREEQKGFKIIGDESQRFLKKRRNLQAEDTRQQKTFGELHLKVSSIRESKSDDKKFYIVTGTKTLHLRAETRDDRVVWLDSLQAAKHLFPKVPLANDLILPFEEITISTDKDSFAWQDAWLFSRIGIPY